VVVPTSTRAAGRLAAAMWRPDHAWEASRDAAAKGRVTEVGTVTGGTMQQETTRTTATPRRRDRPRNTPPPASGAVYGLGMVGALVYFLGTASSAMDVVLAFGKAIIWPALLVYRAFRVLDG
jgi:hypothetical protein